MDDWLPEDYRVTPHCPLQGVPGNRSGQALWCLVLLHRLDTHPRYQKHDVTGDGKPETFCNVAAADLTKALGCGLPRLLARQQIEWLGKQRDWWAVNEAEATGRAILGFPVVACWVNPDPERPSHVALGVPPPAGFAGLYVAQAGATNSSRMSVRSVSKVPPDVIYTHN